MRRQQYLRMHFTWILRLIQKVIEQENRNDFSSFHFILFFFSSVTVFCVDFVWVIEAHTLGHRLIARAKGRQIEIGAVERMTEREIIY